MDGDISERLQKVQQLLGQSVIQLQQFELLLKALLGVQELSGDTESAKGRLDQRIESLRTATLGNLVKKLFDDYVLEDGASQSENEEPLPETPDRITFRFRVSLEMSAERREQTREALSEMVAMRNELVHHLLELYDLTTDSGIDGATDHLESCRARIAQHLEMLRAWIRNTDAARASSAAYMRSAEFRELLVNGITPDGDVMWAAAGIVTALRGAADELAVGGWVPLEAAIAWIAARHPGQTPLKYGCRSWPQVLHQSGAFDLRYRDGEGAGKVAWYRERSNGV